MPSPLPQGLCLSSPSSGGSRRSGIPGGMVVVRKKSAPRFRSDSSITSSASTSSLRAPSAFTSDCDADDEDAMSEEHCAPSSRPLSLAIPATARAQGPYCRRRPNLREILANESPPPWSLAAFMAYLSNNHCLETVEFTMDAGRYNQHYAKMMSRTHADGRPSAQDREYVQALWQRLVEAYIQPNGSREVNLPSDVRDPILTLQPASMPPPPEKLAPAVAKIYELMDESVLVPFLNSVYPQTAPPTAVSCPYDTSDDSVSTSSRTYDDQSLYSRSSRHGRGSPPMHRSMEPHAHLHSPSPRFRQLAPLPLTAPSHRARLSIKPTPTTSSPATPFSPSTIAEGSDTPPSASASGPGMTDDSASTSTSSPTNDGPMTPPTSPPVSDASSHKRDSGMWKRLGRLSGMKVGGKKSHGRLKDRSAPISS